MGEQGLTSYVAQRPIRLSPGGSLVPADELREQLRVEVAPLGKRLPAVDGERLRALGALRRPEQEDGGAGLQVDLRRGEERKGHRRAAEAG